MMLLLLCGSHRHPGYSCAAPSVSNSCSDPHLALPQTIPAVRWKWSLSHESHPTLPAASRTISLWNPFSVRLVHVPVGLHDGSAASPHLPACERGWSLGWAQLSSPSLLPLWRLGKGEQMCQNPVVFYVNLVS